MCKHFLNLAGCCSSDQEVKLECDQLANHELSSDVSHDDLIELSNNELIEYVTLEHISAGLELLPPSHRYHLMFNVYL